MISKVLNFPPHQRRVVLEAFELQDKTDKLGAFLQTPAFLMIDLTEQGRLQTQHGAMTEYLHVLDDRLASFEVPK